MKAYIDETSFPGAGIGADSITLSARDASLIKADAGAASLAAAFGLTGIAASFGGAVAVNGIANDVAAYILDANGVDATGGAVMVEASESAAISSRAEAASVAFAISAIPISVSGAGAMALNDIDTVTRAAVEGSTVDSAGDVSLRAVGASSIDAVAVGLSGAQTGASGAAVATNAIDDTIRAVITDSTVSAAGAVSVDAESTASIRSSAAGVAFASGGVSFAGGVALNRIGTTVEALVRSSDVTAGKVSVKAVDSATITSQAGTVAVGGVAAVGGSAAYNQISNTVRADVTASDLTATGGSIAVEALATGTVTVEAAGGSGGGLAGVAGTIAVQTIAATVEALVDHSSLAASDTILVHADWNGDITADGGAGAAGGILGIGGTIVLNTLLNTVTAKVSASTLLAGAVGVGRVAPRWSRRENGTGWEDDRLKTTEETVRGVAVIASAAESIDSTFATASAGLFGLALNKAVNTIGDTVIATISGSDASTPQTGTGGVIVRARQVTDVDNEGGAAGASGIGGVGGFDTTLINSTVTAAIDNDAGINTIVAGSGGVETSAWSQEQVSSNTGSASASAIAGVAGAISAVEIRGATTATLGESDLTSTGAVRVLATDLSDVSTKAGALSASLLAAAGGSVDYVTIDRDTSAAMNGVHSNAAGDTEVIALSHALINGSSGTVGAGGIVAVVGTGAVHLIEGSTTATIGAGSRASAINQTAASSGNVTVSAVDDALIDSSAGGHSGSIVAGVGGSMNINVIRRDVAARIAGAAEVSGGGDVTVAADEDHRITAETSAFAVSGLVGVAGSLSAAALGGGIDAAAAGEAGKTKTTINGLLDLSGGIEGLLSDGVSARAEAAFAPFTLSIDRALLTTTAPAVLSATVSGSVDVGGDIVIRAERKLAADQQVGGNAIGGLVGVGGSAGFLDLAGTAAAQALGGTTLKAAGDIGITALTGSSAAAGTANAFYLDVTTGNGGFVGIGSAVADLTMQLATTAATGVFSSLTAGGNAAVTATTSLDTAHVHANGTVGGFAAVGDISATAGGSLASATQIGNRSAITADGAISVLSTSDGVDLTAETSGGAGGFVASGGQDATVDFSAISSAVTLGDGSSLAAAGAVAVASDTSSSLAAAADQSATGGVGTAEVKAAVTAVESSDIAAVYHAHITGSSIDLTSQVSGAKAHADATSDAGGLGANSEASATVALTANATLSADTADLAAPAVSILAETSGLDARATSTAIAKAVGLKAVSGASSDVTETATVDLDGSSVSANELEVFADTLSDQSIFVDAAHDTGGLGSATDNETNDIQRTTGIDATIAVDNYATAAGELALEIDASGAAVRQDGIVWHRDATSGAIVVENFFYNGSTAPPNAVFVTNGTDGPADSAWLAGTPTFAVNGNTSATIINNSPDQLRLGSILAYAGEGAEWNVVTSGANNTMAPVIDSVSGLPNQLNVQSAGSIELTGMIDVPVPGGRVTISSDGDISGSGSFVRAGQITIEAGGAVGTSAAPLTLLPGALPLSVVSGGDMSLGLMPTMPVEWGSLSIGTLQSGGDMGVLISPAVWDNGGVHAATATDIVFSGPITAAGDLSMQILADGAKGGSTTVNGTVTAGGSLSIDSDSDLFVYEKVTATGTAGSLALASAGDIYLAAGADLGSTGAASLTAGGSIYAPGAVITATDLTLNAVETVGQVSAPVTVALSGALTAAGGTGAYIRNLGGTLTVDSLLVSSGSASLAAVDAAGTDDLIVVASEASLNVSGDLTLTAGDGLMLASDATVRAGSSLTLNLDNTTLDPDAGTGITMDLSGGLFSDTPVIKIRTGADDDVITVKDLPETGTVLDIATGGGTDKLALGGSSQIVSYVNGSILFDGGDGTDGIAIDNSKGGIAGTGTLWLDNSQVMAYNGFSYPLVRMSGMGDLWYLGVEDIDIALGLPSVENVIDIDATGSEVATLDITGTSGNDAFRIGNGVSHLLSGVHGQVTIDGGTAGNDSLAIIENNFQPGLSFADDRLTATTFTGQGMDGVTWSNISTLAVSLPGNTDLTIAAAPVADTTVTMGTLGTGEHTVTIGEGNFGSAAGMAAFPGGRILNVTTANPLYTLAIDDHLNSAEYAALMTAEGLSINGFRPVSSGFIRNRLLLGAGGGTVAVIGAQAGLELATIVGGNGTDRIIVTGLPSTTVLDIRGGGGNDELRTTLIAAMAGTVFFQGGDGTDKAAWIGPDTPATLYLDQPGGPMWPYGGTTPAFARVYGSGTGDVYYDGAETLDVALSSQADTVHLEATAAGTDTVTVSGLGGDDRFFVGDGKTLANLHGSIAIDGGAGTDGLRIDTSDSTADHDTGTVYDSVLGLTGLSGLGLEQTLAYAGFENLGVYLGRGRDSLALDFVRSDVASLVVSTGCGDDRLRINSGSGFDGVLAVAGGDGSDLLAIDDSAGSISKTVVINGRNIQGLNGAGSQIAIWDDFESAQLLLNNAGNNVEFKDVSLPLEVVGGASNDLFTVTSQQAGQQITLSGNGGADTLKVGDTGSALNVGGAVTFRGGDGDDTAYVYQLAATGAVSFEGDWGNDTLNNYCHFTHSGGLTGDTAEFVDGAVLFTGGAGTDSVEILQNMAGPGRTVVFDSSAAPGTAVEMAHIGGLGMDAGVWYDAETVDLELSTGNDNTISIDATPVGLDTLTVTGSMDRDEFHLGEAGHSLADIHGNLVLSGGGTVEAGYYDRLYVDNSGDGASYNNATISAGRVAGMGLAGALDFSNIAWVTLTAGSGSNRILLNSVPYAIYPVAYGLPNSWLAINNLDGDDIVSMTPAVAALQDQNTKWRLNDTTAADFDGIGVACDPAAIAIDTEHNVSALIDLHENTPGDIAAVWASSGRIVYESMEPTGPTYTYRWTSATNQSQDVTIFARSTGGLVTAGVLHVVVPPYLDVRTNTATEGSAIPLTATFSHPGFATGETYSAEWRIRDAGGMLVGTIAGTVTRNLDTNTGTVTASAALPAGAYQVTLNLTGTKGSSLTDTAQLTVTNQAPVLDLGPARYVTASGLTTPLGVSIGMVSDPGLSLGETLGDYFWNWVVTHDATGATVAASTASSFDLTVPAYGSYTARLTATDPHGASASDTMRILFAQDVLVDAGEDVKNRPEGRRNAAAHGNIARRRAGALHDDHLGRLLR